MLRAAGRAAGEPGGREPGVELDRLRGVGDRPVGVALVQLLRGDRDEVSRRQGGPIRLWFARRPAASEEDCRQEGRAHDARDHEPRDAPGSGAVVARVALERPGEREPIGEAIARLVRERAPEDRLEPRGDGRAADRLDGARAQLGELIEDGLARERRAPGEALVEDGSEGEDVGRGADAARVSELLGRRVAGGALEGALGREREALARPRDESREVLGEPEVRDERASFLGEQDVLRLHVPVDDPARVGLSERARELLAERDGLGHSERPRLEPLPESAARDEGHDEPGRLAGDARVEEPDEALLLPERGEEPSLPLEARERRRVGLREELERRLALPGRPHPVDDAHSPTAELAQDLVAADVHAPGRWHLARARARSSRPDLRMPGP